MNTHYDINIPIKNNHNGNDSTGRHRGTPEANDDITGHNLERHEGCFKDEEIPTSGYAKGIVDESSSEADERGGDRQEGDHFSDTWQLC
jgi:hypothetical protein